MATVPEHDCAHNEVSLLDDATRTVTFVHGTYTSHAEWMQDGRPLPDAIAKVTDPRTTEIHRFCWNGDNLHWGRVAGGRELQQHLLGLAERHPDAEHHVIAHSHGGNVAVYALRGEKRGEVHPALAGVRITTLGTPFLSVERRATVRVGRWIVGGMLLAALMLLVAVTALLEITGVIAQSGEPDEAFVWTDLWAIGIAFALLALLVLPPFISARSYRRGETRVTGSTSGLLHLMGHGPLDLTSFAAPKVAPGRLLVLIGRGDEAGGLLGGAQFLSWLWDRLLTKTVTLVKWSLGLGFVTLSAIGLADEVAQGAAEDVLLVVSLTVLAVPIVGAVAVILLVPLIGISNAPFGRDTMLLNYHLRITAEAAPLGIARIVTVGGLSQNERAHSLHASKPAIENIVSRVTGEHHDLTAFFSSRTDLNSSSQRLTVIAGIGEKRERRLVDSDIDNYEAVASRSPAELAAVAGVSTEAAQRWIDEARTLMG